jgi:hypothetical protein
MGRACRSLLAIRNERSIWNSWRYEPMTNSGVTGRAVRADGEVGDVALDAGHGPRLVLQFTVDALGRAV